MSINSDGSPWPRAITHEDLDWPEDEQRVLVPFHEGANRSETGVLAGHITFGADGELYILNAVPSDDVADTDATQRHVAVKREILERFDIPVRDSCREYSNRLVETFVRSHSITTTVVDEAERRFFSGGSGRRSVAADCHTVVGTGMDQFESPASILVPVAKGPHSGLATRVAEAVAKASDSWIELFHVVPEDASEETRADAEGLLDAYEYRIDDGVDVDHLVQQAPAPADGIIEHAGYHDLTILGAPQKGALRQFLFGSTTGVVTEHVDRGPVLTVHRDLEESTVSRWV